MTNEIELVNSIDLLISEIKKCIRTAGINNDSSEFQIVTEIFLYKFLNDKFKYEAKKISKKLNEATDFDVAFENLTQKEYDELLIDLDPNTAVIKKDQTISYLYNHRDYHDQEGNDFAWFVDKTLVDIASANADIFSVLTEGNNRIMLFEGVCKNIIDVGKRNGFARAFVGKLIDSHNFEEVFSEKYDFFSTIFEHLISEYNANGGGVNAEYYTPKSIAQIIARILITEPVQNVEVCDPTAGSGTLLMAIAHQIGEDKCTIFSQDLTQKSVKLLRLNLILNNLTHSLPNVRQADILEFPQFLNNEKNDLREFDYIVSNPPFKVDFSSTQPACLSDNHVKINGQKRFFAGVPNIPKKDKESMAIYLLVLQHILYSLKSDGRAGIVVPTKFLDLRNSIAKNIREYLISNEYLRAVVSMPSNVFANTGTSVSVIFIDKKVKHDKVILLDASSLGVSETVSINGNNVKKTILSNEDETFIINTINNEEKHDGLSVVVSLDEIKSKGFSLVPGQFFKVGFDSLNISSDEVKKELLDFDIKLNNLFKISSALQSKIKEDLEKENGYDNETK